MLTLYYPRKKTKMSLANMADNALNVINQAKHCCMDHMVVNKMIFFFFWILIVFDDTHMAAQILTG
jgi:hypothetical protein